MIMHSTSTKKPASAFQEQIGGEHYRHFNIQPARFLRENNVPHLEGEIIYRVLRHTQKNGREDLEKAIHSLRLLIEMDYPL